jgi:hypothetical protein
MQCCFHHHHHHHQMEAVGDKEGKEGDVEGEGEAPVPVH